MGNSSSSRQRRCQRADEILDTNPGNSNNNSTSHTTGPPMSAAVVSGVNAGSEFDDDLQDLLPPPTMIRLASHTAALENKVCCVCSDTVEVGLGHLRLGCRCLLHDDCFVHYVRSKSKFDWIKAGGVRCPYSLGGLDCKFEGPGDYVITPDELHQLLILVEEALQEPGSTIEEDEHVSEAPITFDEIEKFREWLKEADHTDCDTETKSPSNRDVNSVFIDVTTKPCPKCGLRSGHMHGHACHHVTGGCERCGEEYCYRCLSTESQNLADRGDRGKCECGYWHSFCTSDDTIMDHLVYEPYPHDSRCGCTICPECRQGDPCPMCDGSCVVCRGYLEHAPSELSELPEWVKQNSNNTINAGSFFIEGAEGDRASRVNGVFDLTDEICNGMPVYRKRNDRDTWMEMVKCNAGGWRWYIKPTKERGPDSSICFGYCSSDEIILPHQALPEQWCVYMGSKFETKPLRVGLSTNTEIPGHILEMVTKRQAEYQVIKDEMLRQKLRPANPGSIIIAGATVDRSKYVNGTFEPTDETCNGMPVYQKKGEPDTWLEMVKCKSGGWRWYIKPTKERGPDTSVCFGYGHHDDIVFPNNCTAANWSVYDGNKFVIESQVTCVSDPNVPSLPDKYLVLLQQKIDLYKAEMEILEAEKLRPPKAGSVSISGATVDRSKFVNGIFEPTDETCNGLPVYQRKGDPDTWMEMVRTNIGTWRWYIKPTKEKGPESSICFGYGSSTDIVFPQDCECGGWLCYDDTKFENEKSITCSLCYPDQPLPDFMIELKASKQESYQRMLRFLESEVNREAREGSILIEGATVDRAKYLNGIFEPTSETCNGMTVYQKKGDIGTWLEVVKTATGSWRWYIKPTKEKGPDKSVCFGYGQSQGKGFPQHCLAGEWCCYDGSEFVVESTITCTVYDPKEVSKRNVGAITIRGATGGTGSRAKLVNGVFEITEERCNGMPVYRKKGDHGTWLEMVQVKAGGWRWYIKPTAEKGPESSICFGYGVSNSVVFPHECDENNWYCYDGTNFEKEESIVASLTYPTLEFPSDIMELKTTKADEYAIEKNHLEHEKTRASKPGSIEIKGAVVDRSKYVNGIFEPTDETSNGMPIYLKKGDPDTCLEMVKSADGMWRWYVKPISEKGPDKSVCFGYGTTTDVVLPQDCKEAGWYVYDDTAFVREVGVTCTLIEPLPLHIQAIVDECIKNYKIEKEAIMLEYRRAPIAGSVIIRGATSSSANGIFEPTEETCNDMTVYRKKGEPSHWLEMVKTTSGWRWYIKPAQERGPDSSVCFGYGFHKEKVTPDKCMPGQWCCSNDLTRTFTVELSMQCSLYTDNMKNEGAVKISGAVGGNKSRGDLMNGVYELSTESSNGMPVYQKQTDPDVWLEIGKREVGGWRWNVKSTKDKGPDSNNCFGFGISDSLGFPHECDFKSWHCDNGSSYVKEEDIVVSLLAETSVPDFAETMRDNLNRELAGKPSATIEKHIRESKPASVIFTASRDDVFNYLHGVFEPTDDICNGMPVYQKMGDPDTWMEMVKTPAGKWRWYVKPTHERGPCNSVCFAYGTSDEVVLPQDCDAGSWNVHDGNTFVPQPEVSCDLTAPNSVSEFIQELVVTQRIAFDTEKMELAALLLAPPLPGSITISGATADRSKFVNGNFELTDEVCNGKPVYRKKGDPEIWMEVVMSPDGTSWRWYVKPSSARGPDSSLCFGYGTCVTLKDPHECDSWYVFDEVDDFVVEDDITCEQEPFPDTSTCIPQARSNTIGSELEVSGETDRSVEINVDDDLPDCANTPV